MRKLLVLFILLTGGLLTSCNEEESARNFLEDQIELEDPSDDSDETDHSITDEVLDENEVMTWKSYHNERFDFCVGYPANFLRPMGESMNHDGNTFANANGSSEMRVSGIFNVLEETINEAFESTTEGGTYYEDERIITYKQQKGNWFVVSGKYYESIFYVRTVLIEDTFYTLYFEYHQSEADKFKEIIKTTTRDFPEC